MVVKNNVLKKYIFGFITFVLPIVVVEILLVKVVIVSVVMSGSMEPTLMTGDTVIYNRLAYKQEEPQRGDIVVFKSNEYDAYFAKRIVGVGGDCIKFRDGKLIVNGYVVKEDYIEDDIRSEAEEDYVVPDNSFFMLGDNRGVSNDSRYWKQPYIKSEDVLGKYMVSIPFSFKFDIGIPVMKFFGVM